MLEQGSMMLMLQMLTLGAVHRYCTPLTVNWYEQGVINY